MARIGLPDTYKGEGVLIIVANLLLIGSIASGNGFLIGISAAFFIVLMLVSRKVSRGHIFRKR